MAIHKQLNQYASSKNSLKVAQKKAFLLIECLVSLLLLVITSTVSYSYIAHACSLYNQSKEYLSAATHARNAVDEIRTYGFLKMINNKENDYEVSWEKICSLRPIKEGKTFSLAKIVVSFPNKNSIVTNAPKKSIEYLFGTYVYE